ncbi:MAG TPA: hypothetical protein PLN13_11805 [Bacteroidia bacterium]|nr:hypothetical protein [Bacteroidia bacterium]HRH09259.1 hypothetical protein [Bacteroidia bacterium]
MDKVKITCFGIGCRIAIGKFCIEDWEKLHGAAKIFNSQLSEAIFDPAYCLELSDRKFKTWFDFGNSLKLTGLLQHYQSSIEIRINGKKQLKILPIDLTGDNLLFPLYQISVADMGSIHPSDETLTIVEKEIGTVANYLFETENFLIDNLHFTLNTISVRQDLNYSLLTNLNYSGRDLISKKSDTVIKERFVLAP